MIEVKVGMGMKSIYRVRLRLEAELRTASKADSHGTLIYINLEAR